MEHPRPRTSRTDFFGTTSKRPLETQIEHEQLSHTTPKLEMTTWETTAEDYMASIGKMLAGRNGPSTDCST